MAASTLRQSDTYLGAQFRRLRTTLGAPRAIKAMAAKLARLSLPHGSLRDEICGRVAASALSRNDPSWLI